MRAISALLTVALVATAAYVVTRLHAKVHPDVDAVLHVGSLAWELFKPGGKLHPASFLEHQGHIGIEVALVVVILWLYLQRSFKPPSKLNAPLTEKEIDELCDEWVPEPLAKPLPSALKPCEPPVVSSMCGTTIVANGKKALNFATSNFLGAATQGAIMDAAVATINKYGVGSCGPRGFYGTVDVHLQLEERLARFLGMQGAILYSYDLATLPSIIPAFANRGDLIVIDEGVNYAIQKGCNLSRARVLTFKHNDMKDLQRVLQGVVDEDARQANRRRPLNRRFLCVEGVYANYGDTCPLDVVHALKERFCFRLILDESISLGVLGAGGRGAREAFGLAPGDVEVVAASLGNALASVGGFCAGNLEVTEHQRLAGLGYCFSASQPPYLATAATGAIDYLEANTSTLLPALAANARTLRQLLADIPGLALVGGIDSASPLIHLQLAEPPEKVEEGDWLCAQIVDECLRREGVMVAAAKYSFLHLRRPPPSVKVTVSAAHEEKEMAKAAAALRSAAKRVLRGAAATLSPSRQNSRREGQ